MRRAVSWVLLLCIFAALLFPIWLMVSNSFSPARGFLRNPPRLTPYEWTTENYQRALSLQYLPVWMVNTVVLTSVMVVGAVIINGAAGYAFAFAQGTWLTVTFWLFMLPIFVTRYTLLISQIRIVGNLGLGGLPAVVSMSLFWAMGIYLFRMYFQRIPHEIIESARLDGATEWRVLFQVVLPMSRPMIGAAIVFVGMSALGDYVWQMLNLQAVHTRTYLVGLMATTIDVYAVKNIGYDMAVGTLLFLPYLAIFAASSKYFTSAIAGAVKG